MMKFNEVSRKATVGERIKIVKLWPGETRYKIGDEFVVDDVNGRNGSVKVDELGERVIAISEYVVLEPVTPEPPAQLAFSEAFALFVRENADAIRKYIDQVEGKAVPAAVDAPRTISRAEVIEMARKDVADLISALYRGRGVDFGVTGLNGRREMNVETHTNRDKRAVTVLLRGIYTGKVWAKGIAKCAPGDVFHAEIGKAIALRKALGLTIPAEYTDAPQPVEKRDGHVITCEGKTLKLMSLPASPRKGEAHVGSYYGEHGTIIDDTDVDYSVVSAKEAA
ncbi:hypothetical protein [Paenibacillus chibensis]|uniref:hypothetical protein n=1 Tax=Paenibacillus chibensis TaxID=59846 RepID=UPI000FD98B0A|nr:hypothetical protein [Paenibacillus chibensis]MEC0370015.1 hypothetical protein [Paenibacillus chibensis]